MEEATGWGKIGTERDGTILANVTNTIIVEANYRLGSLGWFSHPDLLREYNSSGNWALLDLIEALRWVNETYFRVRWRSTPCYCVSESLQELD